MRFLFVCMPVCVCGCVRILLCVQNCEGGEMSAYLDGYVGFLMNCADFVNNPRVIIWACTPLFYRFYLMEDCTFGYRG